MSLPRKIRCQVDLIVDHGNHVYSVDLIPAKPVPEFRPGQFLHLTVDDYDPSGFWPESRVFSIASSPHERGRLRICYSVVGTYTRKMERTLRPGAVVWIKLPHGSFTIDDKRDATLIAGGTGVSAFVAFIDGLAPGYPHAVRLVYGVRTPELLLFREEILRQAASVPRFTAAFFSEAGDEAWTRSSGGAPAGTEYYSGRIALSVACPELTVSHDRVFYLSGPPPMLRALGAQLQAHGVAQDDIRNDAWA